MILQTLLRGAAEVDESDLSVPINNLKVYMYIVHVNAQCHVCFTPRIVASNH